jgi:hypothetical protein
VTTPQQALACDRRPAAMTAAGAYAPRFDGVPPQLAARARVVQGRWRHEHWAPAYGVRLAAERQSASQMRPGERMLARLLVHDDQPRGAARLV